MDQVSIISVSLHSNQSDLSVQPSGDVTLAFVQVYQ